MTKKVKLLQNLKSSFCIFKVRYYQFNLIMDELVYPKRLHLELTSRCNYKCITCAHGYCYFGEDISNYLKNIIINELIPRADYLELQGSGESLLYDGLFDILCLLRGVDIIIFFTLNFKIGRASILKISVSDKLMEFNNMKNKFFMYSKMMSFNNFKIMYMI